jgi:hypothetical protein
VFISTPLLFILSTQRAHTRHLLWQGEMVLLFLRVAGKLPLRYWISCVYIINTSSLHPVNTASSAAPLDIMCLYQYLYFSSCQLKRKLTKEYVDLCQTPSPTASRHLETNKSENSIKGNNKEHHQLVVRHRSQKRRRLAKRMVAARRTSPTTSLKNPHQLRTAQYNGRVHRVDCADDIKQYKSAEFADSDVGSISDTTYRLSLKR